MGLLFARRGTDTSLPRDDRGFGDFDDYSYGLVAKRARVKIVLADSNPHQDELVELADAGDDVETAMPPRTTAQEGVDAPIEVRLFAGRRVSGVVGSVPRGLESIVDENLRRLDSRGLKMRIPARIVRRGGAYRVELLLGALR